jgi:hypothetical protein
MATLGQYYINGATLATATAVFTDADLTVCAPDGWYSDGTIVRQQTSCSLGIVVDCSCALTCVGNPSVGGTTGIYSVEVDTGLSTDVGAVLIYFTPTEVPIGVRATLGVTNENRVTSDFDGFHGNVVPTNLTSFTIVGSNANICFGTVGNYTEYTYNTGTSTFVAGGTQSVTINSDDVSLSNLFTPPTTRYMMVIPKLASSGGNILNVEVLGACPLSAWDVEMRCPLLLTGFDASPLGADCTETDLPQTFFNAPLDGTSFGDPSLYDFIFREPYGRLRVLAGTYKISPTSGDKLITVDSNGVIINITSCPP